MKIKLNNWNGIYSNIDETDTNLEIIKDSSNFRFKKGYAEFESRNLSEFGLPDLSDFPQSFTWETGIYCTLTNDSLSTESKEAWKADVLVIIAKANEGDMYHRLIWFYDITNDDGWHELSRDSSYGASVGIRIPNHNGAQDFTDSYFSTDRDGKAFFQVEGGRLKVYLPHDCFWIGHIDRRPIISNLIHGHWYIDRLSEEVPSSVLKMRVFEPVGGAGLDVVQFPPTTDPDDVFCATGRRLGIKFGGLATDDPDVFFEEEELTFVDQGQEEILGSYYRKYQCKDSTGAVVSPPVQVLPSTLQGTYGKLWLPYVADNLTDLIFIDDYANKLKPASVDGWADLTSTSYGTHAIYVGGSPVASATGWRISRTEFESTNWLYIGGNTIGTAGWDYGTDTIAHQIIVTGVLDEREEIIMERLQWKLELDPGTTKFGLEIKDIFIPKDINKRLTRIRFYHKFPEVHDDFYLHRDIDLLQDDEVPTSFYIGEYTDTGISLSSNIGFLYDYEKPEQYDILIGFKSFVTESGISIGVTSEDTVNLYHSTVGGGNLMADLVYDQNILPISGISNVTAVANINGKIGAFTNSKLYVINSGESLGQLVFSINDTLDVGIKNFNDIVSIQGGALANTRTGILYTDGFKTENISEPINNIVTANYSTSSIYYNTYEREVYFKPTSSEDLYRYRFEDKVWEKINATLTEVVAISAGEAEV